MQIVTDPTLGRMGWTTRDHDDDGREDEVIRQPDIRINRVALRDWINPHRKRAGTRPLTLKHCALCDNPPSAVEWRPWHPALALLCSHHRSQLYLMSAASADRYGDTLASTLTAVLNALIRIDREIDREIN